MSNDLIISNVCKSFNTENGKTITALDQISFCAPQGKIIAILGPSGCGKSSLLNIIAGFEAPDSGVIQYNNMELNSSSNIQSVVFQSPALFEWLTVWKNIEFGLKRQGMPSSQRHIAIKNMLDLVGLTEFSNAYPHELSGGMQQRVALARALVLKPQILLMDEPFAALDAQLRVKMQQLLLSVWEKVQPTVLFITHDIDEALRIAHQIVLLTPQPGKVQKILNIPYPFKNRDITDHNFILFKKELSSSN